MTRCFGDRWYEASETLESDSVPELTDDCFGDQGDEGTETVDEDELTEEELEEAEEMMEWGVVAAMFGVGLIP